MDSQNARPQLTWLVDAPVNGASPGRSMPQNTADHLAGLCLRTRGLTWLVYASEHGASPDCLCLRTLRLTWLVYASAHGGSPGWLMPQCVYCGELPSVNL